jgi:ABC-2 type transport system permease protein
MTWRNLLTYVRLPQLLVFSTIQPIMLVLLFCYVFGNSIALSNPTIDYVDYLMPGVFVQATVFGALGTGVGLAEDLQRGLVERFRSPARGWCPWTAWAERGPATGPRH